MSIRTPASIASIGASGWLKACGHGNAQRSCRHHLHAALGEGAHLKTEQLLGGGEVRVCPQAWMVAPSTWCKISFSCTAGEAGPGHVFFLRSIGIGHLCISLVWSSPRR